MRVAIAGKGGTGKTTIAATVSRLAARGGAPVVAIDADSNPNLATALGIPPDRSTEAAVLPSTIVSRRLNGPMLGEPVEAVLDRHGLIGPDGVRLALMGMPAHADEGCLCAAHATVSAVLGDLGGRQETVTVVDMEASPEHFSRGTARHVDVLLLATEPYYRSLETVRRMARLAADLPIPRRAVVANKVRSPMEATAVGEFCARHDLELIGCVPWSDAILDADLRGEPLLDHDRDAEAIVALEALTRSLLAG